MVKPGTRALGVAESTRGETCLFCGTVVRADRVVDGVGFATATVGGLDATDAVQTLLGRLDREDIRYLLVSGVAPAWFNILDLDRIAAAAGCPVVAVSYEASAGLASTIDAEFDGEERTARLAAYDRLPPRKRLRVNGETVFVRRVDDGERATGVDGDAERVTRDDDGVESVTSDDDTDGSLPTVSPETARVIRAYTPTGGRPEPLRVARLLARGAQQWRAADL